MAQSTAQDKEMQEFLMVEQQKANLQAQIHRLTDTCWDLCVDKPRDKLDYKSEQCLTNCVERFIDTTVLITQRFQTMLTKGMQQ